MKCRRHRKETDGIYHGSEKGQAVRSLPAGRRLRLRIAAPARPKPAIIIAQLSGSGTAKASVPE
jgi:hypothetical protein